MIATIGLGVAAQIGQAITRRLTEPAATHPAATQPIIDPAASKPANGIAATVTKTIAAQPDAAAARLVADVGRMLLGLQSDASATGGGTMGR